MPWSLFTGILDPELTNGPRATMDDFGGGISLTRHLLATGHTLIGAIFPADNAFRTFALHRGWPMPCGTHRCTSGIFPDTAGIFPMIRTMAYKKAMQKLISSAPLMSVIMIPLPMHFTVLSQTCHSHRTLMDLLLFHHSYLCHFGHTEFSFSSPRPERLVVAPPGLPLHRLGILVSSTEIPWKL